MNSSFALLPQPVSNKAEQKTPVIIPTFLFNTLFPPHYIKKDEFIQGIGNQNAQESGVWDFSMSISDMKFSQEDIHSHRF
jgi:hypothetical protein